MSSKSQSMRKVVDKAEKDCTPANQGYAGTKGEDYKVAKAEFGATMKSKLISAIARLVKTHKGVRSYFCYHHQYPVYVCVCGCESAMEIYRRGKLVPDVLYGKNTEAYEHEEWWCGLNADTFGSEVKRPHNLYHYRY